MAKPIFTFDDQSVRRISAAVQKSEGVKDRKGRGWYPVVNKGGRPPALQIGKTSGKWEKGTDATVDLYKTSDRTLILDEYGNPVQSGVIHNLFADVGADSWVAFMNGILIAAECDEE